MRISRPIMRAELPALDDDEYPPPLDPAGYDSDDEVIVLSPANDPIYSRPANYSNYCRRVVLHVHTQTQTEKENLRGLGGDQYGERINPRTLASPAPS